MNISDERENVAGLIRLIGWVAIFVGFPFGNSLLMLLGIMLLIWGSSTQNEKL